jgi:hypothetical protein
MLTKIQYAFLKDFNLLAKENSRKDDVLKEYNRAKVSYKQLEELLNKHTSLIPSRPYRSKDSDDDNLTDTLMENSYLPGFLEECGLEDVICKDNAYYVLSQKGRSEIDQYLLEIKSKVTLPVIAIVISCLSFLIALAAMIISAVKITCPEQLSSMYSAIFAPFYPL